jgi:cytidine deaminase
MKNPQELIDAAKQAAARAYSPYSKFRVGAALRTNSGDVFSGCNVVDASSNLMICAERNAVFQAVAAGEMEIEALVLYTPTAAPVVPCPACRRAINEFGPNAKVLCVCDSDSILELSRAHPALPASVQILSKTCS